MKKIGIALVLVLLMGITLVEAGFVDDVVGDAVANKVTKSASNLMELFREFIGLHEKVVDGVPFIGEYEMHAFGGESRTMYNIMPNAECDYVAYATDDDGRILERDFEASIEVWEWDGEHIRRPQEEWTGFLDFSDEFFLVGWTMERRGFGENESDNLIGHFQYSCG